MMVQVKLEAAMETSLITLYGKALDARRPDSVLHDELAAQAVDKIDYDWSKLKMSPKVAPNVTARAKHFDDWTRDFVAQHDTGTVVHLGAGLDPRAWRIDPHPGITWYDVDFPDVIAIREQLYPARENYRMIPSSVTAPDWLDQVPAEHPVLVVAEGLTMYLHRAEGHALANRITDRFARGVLAFDAHNPLAVRLMNRQLAKTVGAAPLHWGIADGAELERADPRLRCTDVVSAFDAPSAAVLGASMRAFATLTRPIRPVHTLGLYLRYVFPATACPAT